MIVAAAYYLLLSAAVAATFIRGDRSQQLAAIIMVVATAFTAVATRDIGPAFAALNLRLVIIDGAAFAALAVLACRATMFWPLWAAALQLLAVAGAVAPWFDKVVYRLPYAISEQIWAWPLLLLLVVMALWGPALRTWAIGE